MRGRNLRLLLASVSLCVTLPAAASILSQPTPPTRPYSLSVAVCRLAPETSYQSPQCKWSKRLTFQVKSQLGEPQQVGNFETYRIPAGFIMTREFKTGLMPEVANQASAQLKMETRSLSEFIAIRFQALHELNGRVRFAVQVESSEVVDWLEVPDKQGAVQFTYPDMLRAKRLGTFELMPNGSTTLNRGGFLLEVSRHD